MRVYPNGAPTHVPPYPCHQHQPTQLIDTNQAVGGWVGHLACVQPRVLFAQSSALSGRRSLHDALEAPDKASPPTSKTRLPMCLLAFRTPPTSTTCPPASCFRTPRTPAQGETTWSPVRDASHQCTISSHRNFQWPNEMLIVWWCGIAGVKTQIEKHLGVDTVHMRMAQRPDWKEIWWNEAKNAEMVVVCMEPGMAESNMYVISRTRHVVFTVQATQPQHRCAIRENTKSGKITCATTMLMSSAASRPRSQWQCH